MISSLTMCFITRSVPRRPSRRRVYSPIVPQSRDRQQPQYMFTMLLPIVGHFRDVPVAGGLTRRLSAYLIVPSGFCRWKPKPRIQIRMSL